MSEQRLLTKPQPGLLGAAQVLTENLVPLLSRASQGLFGSQADAEEKFGRQVNGEHAEFVGLRRLTFILAWLAEVCGVAADEFLHKLKELRTEHVSLVQESNVLLLHALLDGQRHLQGSLEQLQTGFA
jgi:hypothetical protein